MGLKLVTSELDSVCSHILCLTASVCHQENPRHTHIKGKAYFGSQFLKFQSIIIRLKCRKGTVEGRPVEEGFLPQDGQKADTERQRQKERVREGGAVFQVIPAVTYLFCPSLTSQQPFLTQPHLPAAFSVQASPPSSTLSC